MKRIFHKLLDLLIEIKKPKQKAIIMAVVLVLIFSVVALVYFTGGLKYVYSHTMYIPIIISGMYLGWQWGLLFALFAGFLLGPFMPVDVTTGEMQLTLNWLFRTISFSIVGLLSGIGSNISIKYIVSMKKAMYTNHITNLPNINSLLDITLANKNRTVISIHIKNYDSIINYLGTDIYVNLINIIYNDLKKNLPLDATIVQGDNDKLWLTITAVDINDEVNFVLSILNRYYIIKNIPLYVEYAVGANMVMNMEYAHPMSYQVAEELAHQASIKDLPYIIYDENSSIHDYDIAIFTSFIKAIEYEQLFIAYQPKVDLITNEVIGFEALVRWDHPERGLLMPDSFIPLIENTQLIDDLTYYVIQRVIVKLKSFKKLNINKHIAINISIKNLSNSKFIDNVLKIICDNENISKLIEFEITESVLIDNTCKQQLRRLYDAGFKISIDDFGKGYSSLSYLNDIKFNTLKIDKHFIFNIHDDDYQRYIVKAVIDLSHNLGYKIVAEGVESKEAHEIVKKLNCNYGQGFFYARPIDEDDVIAWINDYHPSF